jgi:hypothetical protein
MALYEKLSSSSSPEEIAAAYDEFIGLAGGDTAANQKQAVDYLSSLGIGTPTIEQAYGIYTAPDVDTSVSGLSTLTSGSSDLSGTSGNTGALTQATSGLTDASSGALDQAASTVGSTTAVANPYDAINTAFMAGDYSGTAGVIANAGLTPAEIKAY